MTDTIETRPIGTIDGFHIAARIVPDTDTRPDDYECYTDEQTEAWKRAEWSYVGTIVTASKAGVALGESSIWGSEHGYVNDGSGWISPLDGDGANFINGYGPALISEALTEAKSTLEELTR
jgi:hypothetical protein